MSSPDVAPVKPPGDHRLLAALSYVPGLCIVALVIADADAFVRHHARQGLVLLFLEIVAAAAFGILDTTLGRVPFLGAALVGLCKMIAGLTFVAAAAIAAARAGLGEMFRLPLVGDYARRLDF